MTQQKQQIQDVINDLSLSVASVFIPWSLSRNAGEKDPSLNWRVTVHHNGKAILTTPYMAGCGHCPSYKQGDHSVHQRELIKRECETGHRALSIVGRADQSMGQPIRPDSLDVLYSLVQDASAIDDPNYEDYAREMGEDADSRKGEATYRLCLEFGLKLRAALGEAGLQKLREAFSDY